MKTFFTAILILAGYHFAMGQDKEYKLKEEYDISPTGTLYLATDDANVTIEATDRENVLVDIYRNLDVRGVQWGEDRFEIKVDERDGNLYIRERNDSRVSVSFGVVFEDYDVRIKVPKGVSLNLDGDDDDYELTNIGGSIEIDADDSDVQIFGATGTNFKFDLDDGDLEMDQGAGDIIINLDDGDAFIENAEFTSIDADMDDGELSIETSLADSGDYYFRSSDGRINLFITGGGGEFDISHDDGSVRASREFEYIQEKEHRSVLKLPKGNARVRITSDDARVSLEIL